VQQLFPAANQANLSWAPLAAEWMEAGIGRRAPLPLSLNKELFSGYSSLLEMWRSFMKKWKEALFE